MGQLALVCLGGALGSGSRHLISIALGRAFGAAFSWGTLLVNLLGSFLIELVFAFVLTGMTMSDVARLGLATGFLGGFTTYSTLNHEVLSLLRGGQVALALGYFAVTAIGALLFGLAGYATGRALWPS